jgi:hypothetical protein
MAESIHFRHDMKVVDIFVGVLLMIKDSITLRELVQLTQPKVVQVQPFGHL